MKAKKTVRVRHHYSGAQSRDFWRRINAFPGNSYEHGTLLHAGILLQELEERVLAWLFHFEGLLVGAMPQEAEEVLMTERADGWYWIKQKAWPTKPHPAWQVVRFDAGVWHTTYGTILAGAEVSEIGPRVPPPDLDFGSVLMRYAEQLRGGEMLEGDSLAATLEDAAEQFGEGSGVTGNDPWKCPKCGNTPPPTKRSEDR